MGYYRQTTATQKIQKLSKRLRCVQGGTSASKTVSIILYLIHLAQSDTEPTVTSVVSESFPHLKRGAMKDFLDILKTHKYYEDKRWNRSDYIYTFETGSKIEFFSADQPGKVRGPRRDRLFINEANNISFENFDQLEVRTKEFIFLDWNPISEFWYHEEVENRTDQELIILTYKDNEGLPESIVQAIEQRKNRKNWWQVYGEGLLGEAEGRIYTNWQVVDEIPHEARLERYGLDFGYTNDPTAIIAIYYYNGGYILDEVMYRTGMKNRQIADTLASIESAVVVADSAEPKSIDEIKERGINIVPAKKGQGSVKEGIDKVQDQKVSVTKRSINLLKEYRGYLWQTDKDGRITNDPIDFNDHCMAAVRYGLSSKLMSVSSMETIFSQLEQPKVFDKYGLPV